MRPVLRVALVLCCAAVCCVTPLAHVAAQTNSVPTATNPGDAKEVPTRHNDGGTAQRLAGGAGTASTAAVTMVDPAKSMDGVLAAVEKDIVALAEAMPADKYTFAPKNSDFTSDLKPDYTGVRTFGQEIAHIAAGNYIYIAMATGTKPAMDLATVSKGVDKDTAVASLKASFAAMHAAIATLTVANAFEHQGRGPNDSRIGVFAGGLAHQRDHYGQLVEYARMNGITPPASVGRPPANPAKM